MGSSIGGGGSGIVVVIVVEVAVVVTVIMWRLLQGAAKGERRQGR